MRVGWSILLVQLAACGSISDPPKAGGPGGSGPAAGNASTGRTGGTTSMVGGMTAPVGGIPLPGVGGTSQAAAGIGGTTPLAGGATGGVTALVGGANGGTTALVGGANGGTTALVGGANGGTTVPSTTGPVVPARLPCDVLSNAGSPCVSAHSTVRIIVSGYTGPLYQVCKDRSNPGPGSCRGATLDIMAKDGYADGPAHDAFCSTSGNCTITKIYDQSGQGNHLEPAPKGEAKPNPDSPAKASALPVTIAGHAAYGVLIKPGMGYRTGCLACNIKQGHGMALGDQPQSIYIVTSQLDLIDQCCFDYGNAETTSHNEGSGTVEALYFGGGVIWASGYGGKPGPWVMADLENGLYSGTPETQDKVTSTNMPLKFNFVTAVLLGDTGDKNAGKGRFALYGGDATSGGLQTMFDGIRPEKGGYVPMSKQGSIVLGIAGDNSNEGGGRFYEGAVAAGPVLSKAQLDQLQTLIVAARYGQ